MAETVTEKAATAPTAGVSGAPEATSEGSAAALKQALRGKDLATQEAMLAPGGAADAPPAAPVGIDMSGLSLMGDAGPAAMTAASSAPKVFQNPAVDAAWRSHPALRTPEVKTALTILDGPAPSGPWKNVSWTEVRDRALHLVFEPHHLQQGKLPLCGPAAIVNTLISSNPPGFAAIVRDIFTTGTWDGRSVSEELLGATPQETDTLDWMVLSAIRDAENLTLDYEGTAAETVAGMTPPGEMVSWMTKVLHCTDVERLTSYGWGEGSNTAEINSRLTADSVIYMLVDSDRLQHSSAGANVPDHWIRLLSPIVPLGESGVMFKAFTWGSEMAFEFKDVDGYEDVLFEFVIGRLPARGGPKPP